jgi:hypothetical protein
MTAILLAVVGTLLLAYAILRPFIDTGRSTKPEIMDDQCGSTSPDGKYFCDDHMFHYGWCSYGDIEWSDNAWAIGSDDNTRMDGLAVTKIAPAPDNTTDKSKKTSILMFVAAIFILGGGCGAYLGASHVDQRVYEQKKAAEEARQDNQPIVLRCHAMQMDNCVKNADGHWVNKVIYPTDKEAQRG